MSEFKGNKDKWMCYRRTDQHKIEEIRTDKGGSICAINFTLENSEANAKLLVKSREMLEMLELLIATFRYNDDLEAYEIERLKKAEQLIKEATEL